MVEESAILKHRQVNAPPPPPPQSDEDDDMIVTKESNIEEVEKQQPGLIWRVGSGLWGASTVSVILVPNKFFQRPK